MSNMPQLGLNMSVKLFEPRGLTIDAIERACPAIFAASPDSRVSNNYTFIPTRPVMEAIQSAGWVPTGVQNQMAGRGRNARVNPVGAHIIRFRQTDVDPTAEPDGYPELVLVNSHDRTKRYQLFAGMFRLVCTNGLVIGTTIVQPVRITHYNVRATMDELITGAMAIGARATQIIEHRDRMRAREMKPEESLALAAKAIEIRYRGYPTQLEPGQLLLARRPQDEAPSLWNVTNRIQEHLMVGGISTGRSHTKPMASLFEGLSLNTQLWDAAAAYLN